MITSTKEFGYEDFMPRDHKGKPIKENKAGALRFSCKLGSCYDSLIEETMNSIVPKHKSYLKEKDLINVQKPTKEQIMAKDKKEKAKTAVDIMFGMVVKEHNLMEKEDRELQEA